MASRAASVKRSSRARSESASAQAKQGKAKPPVKREFTQKDGFSVLPPDAAEYKGLQQRQKIADKARPKPTAAQIRFDAVLNPAAAASSDAERQAARDRWVADMQAKADPVQIRRAARQREEEKRDLEQKELTDKRKVFEDQWHEREAKRQEVQQERTVEANTNARQRWGALGIEAQLPMAQPWAEPVMPPEEVDFGAVRRRLALAGRAAVNTPPMTVANAAQPAPNVSHPRTQSQTRSGALAISSKLAREKMLSEQEHQIREKQQLIALREEARGLMADQDAEFQMSLLHDQVRDLAGERDALVAQSSSLRQAVAASQSTKENAERRISRYGENPKLRSEREVAEHLQEEAEVQLTEILNRLAVIEADHCAKQELLDASAACMD